MLDDIVNAATIVTGLETRFIGRNFLYFDTVTSTMDIARSHAISSAPEGTAIFAEMQTRGRGRLKREWLTPKGNIAVSIILYPPKNYVSQLIMLSSLAVKNAIQHVTGLDCRLKWPNDILINEKKVSGTLIETKMQIDKLDYAIIGIGINVNMEITQQKEISGFATSLAHETGHTVPRSVLLPVLFKEMEHLYTSSRGNQSLFSEWKANLGTLGQFVQAHHAGSSFEGVAEDVETDGTLLIREQNGNLLRFTVGDVSLRK